MSNINVNNVNTVYYRNIDNNRSYCQTNVFQEFNDLIDTYEFQSTNQDEIELLCQSILEQQGPIEKVWDGIKNKLNLKNSSNNLQKQIELYKNNQISKEEVQKSIDKFKKGQIKALDFVADWGSTIVGALAFTAATAMAAPVSIPVALGIAALSGGIFKCGTKFIDAKAAGREYNTAPYDIVTGSINGFLSPIVSGIGNAATKNIAKKLGVEAVGKTAQSFALKSSFDNIIGYLAVYPKQILSGKIIPKLASYTTGKAIRGISKFGIALGMREIAFKAFSKKIDYNPIAGKIITTMNPDIITISDMTQDIDFSNDVFNTKNKKENNEEINA